MPISCHGHALGMNADAHRLAQSSNQPWPLAASRAWQSMPLLKLKPVWNMNGCFVQTWLGWVGALASNLPISAQACFAIRQLFLAER